jgi:hypothetical protein
VAATSILIRNYQYYPFSSRDSSNPPATVILLYDTSNARFASLFFAKDEQVAIPAGYANGYYRLAYGYSDLPIIIDMLRNETPVFLIVDPAGAVDNWRISTSEEPVGEGEH